MSKKFVIISIIVGLVVGILGGVFYFSKKNSNKIKEPSSLGGDLTDNVEEAPLLGDLTYDDESGFSFSYPSGIEIEDTTPDDDLYYSELRLRKDGKLIKISVLDTKETNIDTYVKKDTVLGETALYGAVKLGGMPAKQYSTEEALYTMSIDQGVLYMIEGPKDGNYWEKVQGVVVDSFILAGQKSQSESGSVNNTIYEEEEVVE